MKEEDKSIFRNALAGSSLTEREKMVLEMRLSGATFSEVGYVFDVSRERARQIEAKAKFKIIGA